MLQATTNTVPTSSSRVPLVIGGWLALATTLSLAGAVRVPQVVPLFLASTVLGFVIAYRRSLAFRGWVDALPMRAVIAAHALRLPIGAAFLWEESRGLMSPTFAQRAGWGDIAVGVAAIAVAAFAWRRRAVVRAFAWFGLIDILIALGTAMYLLFGIQDPLTLSAVQRLPYPMVPLAVVPLVIVTHLWMLGRSRR